jgi:hypothetical protein
MIMRSGTCEQNAVIENTMQLMEIRKPTATAAIDAILMWLHLSNGGRSLRAGDDSPSTCTDNGF